jgi:hypothetical protein
MRDANIPPKLPEFGQVPLNERLGKIKPQSVTRKPKMGEAQIGEKMSVDPPNAVGKGQRIDIMG